MNREERIQQAEKEFQHRLTDRSTMFIELDNFEKQVLRCMLAGLTHPEMVEVLKVKKNTMTYARHKIKHKLQAKNTAEIILITQKLGLI